MTRIAKAGYGQHVGSDHPVVLVLIGPKTAGCGQVVTSREREKSRTYATVAVR